MSRRHDRAALRFSVPHSATPDAPRARVSGVNRRAIALWTLQVGRVLWGVLQLDSRGMSPGPDEAGVMYVRTCGDRPCCCWPLPPTLAFLMLSAAPIQASLLQAAAPALALLLVPPAPDLTLMLFITSVLRSTFCPQLRIPRTTYATAGRARRLSGVSGVENIPLPPGPPRPIVIRTCVIPSTNTFCICLGRNFSVGHSHAGLDIWPCRLLVVLQPFATPRRNRSLFLWRTRRFDFEVSLVDFYLDRFVPRLRA